MPLCPTSSDPEYVTMFSGTNPPYTFQYRFVNTKQENEMYVPANPHEAYRFGVERALAPLTDDEKRNWVQKGGYVDDLDMPYLLTARRKKLLTKKVTKWFAVYNNDSSGSLRVVGQFTNDPGNGQGIAELFDTKEKALYRLRGLDAVGAFPFEVEVEL